MDLYFSPLACSMATRIALHEAGASANFIEVDTKAKLTRSGEAFLAVNPLGLVPTLRTDDGDVITENAAILQYVASRFPEAKLAPTGPLGNVRLQQWLCFVGTELHQAVFNPLLSAKAPEGAKQYALELAPERLDVLSKHLTGREFLLDTFSVADAYLVTVLGWSVVTPLDLRRWPVLQDYVARLRERPSVAQAFNLERDLYARELAR